MRTIAKYFTDFHGVSEKRAWAFVIRIAKEMDETASKRNLTEVRHFAATAWSSQEVLRANSRNKVAFFNLIQMILNEDKDGEAMKEVARYCRTLNRFVVTRVGAAASSAGDDGHIKEGAAASLPEMTERGAWLPLEQVKCFSAGRVYRCPRYLATSGGIGIVAKRFIAENPKPMDTPEQFVPVEFRFYFDRAKGCEQVNLMKGLSYYPDEEEWLFAPYSAFRVRKAADLSKGTFSADDPVIIEIDVLPDNREESESLPLQEYH